MAILYAPEPREKSSPVRYNFPPGMGVFRRIGKAKRVASIGVYQVYVLAVTYLLYVTYHLSRKPLSVVKNVLHRDCTNLSVAEEFHTNSSNGSSTFDTGCSWEPFEGKNYKDLYATLDFTYWTAYAVAMFFVGSIVERTNVRCFLAAGMIFAGFWTIAFGMSYVWNIHHFSYFVVIQVFGGVFQATGWPSMVAVVGNWFGKSKRGLIFGAWNSHSGIGNILGLLFAGVFVEWNWGLSFIVPGIMIMVCGVLAYLFVIVRPEDAGFPPQNTGTHQTETFASKNSASRELDQFLEKDPENSQTDVASQDKPVKFLDALRIPGVIEFSMCLFFSKAVSYVFLVWLPLYIRETSNVASDIASYLSIIFDIGGIAGGILAGGISDWTGAPGIVSGASAVLGAPMMLLVLWFSTSGKGAFICLMLLSGITVGGPYALITTAVSADLGTSLKGKSSALATVTGIINGIGSAGSALGPLVAGLIAARLGWPGFYYFLALAQLVAGLCLARVVYREIISWKKGKVQS